MPILIIYGLESLNPVAKEKFINQQLYLRQSLAEILKIDVSAITVFSPISFVELPNQRELIIFVKALFDKPDRTEAVKKIVAEAVKDWFVQFLLSTGSQFSLVEVFVERFGSKETEIFASWEHPQVKTK